MYPKMGEPVNHDTRSILFRQYLGNYFTKTEIQIRETIR